jgi:hypothetical protein
MLHGQPNRHVAWLILFNHKQHAALRLTSRWCHFNRADCHEQEGWLLGNGPCHLILPDGRPSRIKEVIFQRPKLQGRATYVAVVEIVDTDVATVSPASMVQVQARSNHKFRQGVVRQRPNHRLWYLFTPRPPAHRLFGDTMILTSGHGSTQLEAGDKRNGRSITVDQTEQFSGNRKFDENSSYIPRPPELILSATVEVEHTSLKDFTAGQQLILKESWPLE